MKVKVRGDIVSITSIVKYDELAKADKIIISDDKGNEVYGMTVGTPNISKFGYSANTRTLDGYCMINLVIPSDLKDEEEMKAFVCDNFSEELANLKKFEPLVVKALEEQASARTALSAEIEVE